MAELDDQQRAERALQRTIARNVVGLILELEERTAEAIRGHPPMSAELELRIADLMVVIAGLRELALIFQDAVAADST